jgi:hypothetical protein
MCVAPHYALHSTYRNPMGSFTDIHLQVDTVENNERQLKRAQMEQDEQKEQQQQDTST